LFTADFFFLIETQTPFTFLPKGCVGHRCDLTTLYDFIDCRFSGPLLSVAGQRVVLNLKSLPTRTYSTRELSCEVDRQLEAFSEAHYLSSRGRDGLDDSEEGRTQEM
jgi:hypothetical protein